MKLKYWSERKKSRLVKSMIQDSNRSAEDISRCLGISRSYFNNKLHRNSFSFDDLIIIAEFCDYEICILSKPNKNHASAIDVDCVEWFGGKNSPVYQRISAVTQKEKLRKREEYEKKKLELEELANYLDIPIDI